MSSERKALLDCYGPLAHEETILFNRRDAWNTEDALDEKYKEYLMPSSTVYFSRLRPLFSFEIKTLSPLNNFSHILFRDGGLFLLRFFIRFNEPGQLRCKILIHSDLSGFVPPSWQDHVLFYNLVSLEKPKSNLDELILHLTPDSYRSEEDLLEEVRSLKELYKGTSRFSLLLTHNTLRGEDYLNYCRFNEFNAYEVIKRELASEDIELLSLSDFWAKDFYKSEFYSFKGGRILNSDSYFEHHVLSRGGKVSGVGVKSSADELIHLSPHHAMAVSNCSPSIRSGLKELLFDQLNFPEGDLFKSEPADVRGIEDYFKVFYYSKDLMELASYINFKLVK